MSTASYRDDRPNELFDGRVVTMSPRPSINHNIVLGNIYSIFKNFLKGKPDTVFCDGVDVFLTERDRVIPDVMIVCNKNIIRKWGIHGTPDLIVEVLSAGTAKNDRRYKKDLYEKCGVKEYWIVETETLSVEVYLLIDEEFLLDEIYTFYSDDEIEEMSEEEKSELKSEFKTTLYPNLIIPLAEVFDGRF